jgi:hypothetical protein
MPSPLLEFGANAPIIPYYEHNIRHFVIDK